MIQKSVSLLFLFFFLLNSCKKKEDDTINKKVTLIVQGYLYAGIPIDNILIQTVSFDGQETTTNMANLNPIIEWNGVEYALEDMPNKIGYYYCPDSNLQVIAGDTYSIKIEQEDNIVHASTVVPPPINSFAMDLDTIFITEGNGSYNSINITWQTPEGYKTALSILNVEELSTLIIQDGIIDCSSYSNPSPFDQIILNKNISLHACDFSHYGQHKLMLATINPEAEFLFQNNTLLDILPDGGNIINGSGIFTSFNGILFDLYIL
jgi:hypothetical protein